MGQKAFNRKSGNKILVIIPARGGSKRLVGKNIRKFCGKPLIAWTIELARKCKYVDKVIVSTDDLKIAKIAKEYGADVPFLRPKSLATDNASTIDVLEHAIRFLKQQQNYYPDFICLLQPTSPLRKLSNIEDSIKLLIDKRADACVSVVPTKINPYYTNTIDNGFYKKYFNPGGRDYVSTLKPVNTYILNGSIYIVRTDLFLKEKTLEPKKTVAYVMDEYSSVDIDTLKDFEIAEFIMSRGF